MKIYQGAIVAGLLAASPSQAASLLEQLSPNPTAYAHDADYGIATPVFYLDGPHVLGPSVADVTGTIFRLTGSDGSYGLSLGCDASDYGSGVSGSVVLLSRGTCTFAEKIHLAQDAGALAVLIADYDTTNPRLDFTGRDDDVTIVGFRLSAALAATLAEQTLSQSTRVRLALGDDLVSSLSAPEPASWAMMLGGFGMIGGALRSRRRATVRFA